MTPGNARPDGWRAMRFDQFAENVAERVDPAGVEEQYYVGLEHLDPESLKIRRWGTPDDVKGQKLRFREGDIIFGRRRFYQRKVAVAEFDGICSAHAMVLRAREGVMLQDFFPFFLQSEIFYQRAMQISVGSLSPTINWRALARQEFVIPPLDEQRRIADILWAADTALWHWQEVERHFRAAMQSVVDRLFLKGVGQNRDFETTSLGMLPAGWEVVKLSEVTKKIVDGVHKRPTYTDSGIPFITVENLTRGPGIDFSDTRFVSKEDHREFTERANPEFGDVLVSKDGTLGVARLVETDREFSIFVSVALLKPDPEKLDGRYLRSFFGTSIFKKRLSQKASGSALKHIHLVDFRSSAIPLPSLLEQRRIAGMIEELDGQLVDIIDHKEQAASLRQSLLNRLLSKSTEI
jgi:type I restriction enzyme S subunit